MNYLGEFYRLKQQKNTLLDEANSHKNVLKITEQIVVVTALADSSINLAVRVWAAN
jgi:small conductance mechanosensitive channel